MDSQTDKVIELQQLYLHDSIIASLYRSGSDLVIDILPEPGGSFEVRRLVFQNAKKSFKGKIGFSANVFWMYHEVCVENSHIKTRICASKGNFPYELVIWADDVLIEYV